MRSCPLIIGGQSIKTDDYLNVRNPYSGVIIHKVYKAGMEEAKRALKAAEDVRRELSCLPSYVKSDILLKASQIIKERNDELARLITIESGKPIKESRTEVERASLTFNVASEETKRIGGEMLPLDLNKASEGRWGITKRYPSGTVFGITPFNFPLNLVAHKVAPAIASGNPIIIKPSSKTPRTALALAEMLYDAGLTEGSMSVLPCSTETAGKILKDGRVKVFSFTGSAEVGWSLKAKVPHKRVLLELGGNAGVIIDDSVDLEYAVKRCTIGGFSFSGQLCISVQRIYVHQNVYNEFLNGFVESVRLLKLGDPLSEETDIGPVIDKDNLERIESWVDEAVSAGARIITGGRSIDKVLYEPTVLTDVSSTMKLSCKEVFAPIVSVAKIKDFDAGLQAVNDSEYGLQAGVFTSNMNNAFKAFDELVVGGVVVNDVPTFRVDHMPYGGVKQSGFGREGIKYAIKEMTELRLMVLNLK